MFEIQNGQCVRLLSGSTWGFNIVRVSPWSQYTTWFWYDGIIRIWNFENSRLVNKLWATSVRLLRRNGPHHVLQSVRRDHSPSPEKTVVCIWDLLRARNLLCKPTQDTLPPWVGEQPRCEFIMPIDKFQDDNERIQEEQCGCIWSQVYQACCNYLGSYWYKFSDGLSSIFHLYWNTAFTQPFMDNNSIMLLN